MPHAVDHLDRDVIQSVLPAVVQIVALRQAFMGNYQPAWTGSGTIVHPQGVILTNCHVANPRAMGMPAPPADVLGVAITERSDQPPVLTYVAQIVAQAPDRDLAVLRISGRVDGKKLSRLSLPYVPIGDSDALELGDIVSIFGYPGIGGETITFTSGSVSGFTQQRDIAAGRAWIKTDATIAGGNSGGTAVNSQGFLVGVPTQAAAGTGVTPVDARPVVDTNHDGRVDDRDTPMAIGGFINGMRPVNLAVSLLEKAGMKVVPATAAPPSHATESKPAPAPEKPGTLKSLKSSGKKKPKAEKSTEPVVKNLVFCEEVTKDGRPVSPSAIIPSGRTKMFASFLFENMADGAQWSQVWALDGKPIYQDESKWSDGAKGIKALALSSNRPLPEGKYHLVLTLGKKVVAEGEVMVGRQETDNDTEVSGQVIDRESKRGIGDALVIALKPGVRTADFVKEQRKDMAFTATRTDRSGRFTFPQQLPKGQAYSLVVVARGYRDMTVESALRISANAPEKAQIYPVPMIKQS